MDTDDDKQGALEGLGALRSAPLIQLTVVALIATALPYFVPGVSDTVREYYGDYGVGAPLLLISMLAVEWARRVSPARDERRFWLLVNGALACWLANWLVTSFSGDSYWAPGMQFATDLLNLGYYAFLLLAVVVRPDVRDWAIDGRLRGLRFVVVLLLLFIAVVYFIAIPAQLGGDDWFDVDPALFTYVGFDLLLLGGFTSLWRASGDRLWRTVYCLLAVTSATWLILDGIEAAMWVGWVPYVYAGTPLDLAWIVPYAPLVMAAQLRVNAPFATAGAESGDYEPVLRSGGPDVRLLIASIALLPTAHIAISSVGLGDPSLRQPRDVLILISVVVLAALALTMERRVESLRAISADVLRDELERRRSAAARLAAVTDRDQRFIARTLDREIEPALTRASRALSSVTGVSGTDASSVDEIGEMIVRARRRVLDLAQVLEPESVERRLMEALRSLGNEIREQTDVQVEVHQKGSDAVVPADVRIAVLCFVREALFNAADHSLSTTAEVTVSIDADHVRAEVADHGTGFDPADVVEGAAERAGFDRMRQVVRDVGGRVDIDTALGAGARVTAEIPL